MRGRIDLKYALGLELTDPGFDCTLLSDFRTRLIEGGAEQVLLDAMSPLFQEQGWLKQRQSAPGETGEATRPHLITHVATTAATTTDEAMTETIHADLEQTDLTPRQRLRGFWLYHGSHSGQQSAPLCNRSDWPWAFDVKWQANTDQGIDGSTVSQ